MTPSKASIGISVLLLACAGALADDAATPPELAAAQAKHEAEVNAAIKKINEDFLAELGGLKKKAMADGKLELALFYENAANNPESAPANPPREWPALQQANAASIGKATAEIHRQHIADLIKMKNRCTAAGLLEQAVAVDGEIRETRQDLREAAPSAADIKRKLTGQTWGWDKDATLLLRDNGAADYAYAHNNYEMRKGGRKIPPHMQLVSTDRVNRKFSWSIDNPAKRIIKCVGDGHVYKLVLSPTMTAADVYENDKRLRRITCIGGGQTNDAAPPPPELLAGDRAFGAALEKAAKKANEDCAAELAGLKKKALDGGNLALAVAVDGELKALKAAPSAEPAGSGAPPEVTTLRERRRLALAAACKTLRENRAADLALSKKKAMAELDLDGALAFDRRLRDIQADLASGGGNGNPAEEDASGKAEHKPAEQSKPAAGAQKATGNGAIFEK